MRLAVLLVLLVLTIAGAAALSFQCDDAYITFRYVSHARDGLGLVWNPPPFLPVEGYTSFLWALILWGVWSVFGVEPPDAANVLSILCGVGQFAVVAVAALRLRGRDGAPVGDAVALVTVACITGNRTFLQWMTSGLETALFNLGFVAWVLLAFRAADRRDTRWLFTWSAAAALAALTRPDGLLLVAATVVAALPALAAASRRATGSFFGLFVGLSPLATVLAHVLWRRSFYGEWLPNTYYAKLVAPWPEAGIPYWNSFLFEHGLWLWFPVALAYAVAWCVRHRGEVLRAAWWCLPAFAALAAIGYHTSYYILRVGGDHFEYRVLSQLVPLAWLSLAAMAAQLAKGRLAVLATLGVVFVFSTVGWVHLALSRDPQPAGMGQLSRRLPAFVQPIWRWHDSMQLYLHSHFVGLRCNQHAVAFDGFRARYPRRGEFPIDAQGDVPVLVEGVVGIAGWVMRDCAVVDRLGLNDWVTARTPLADWQSIPQVVYFQDLLLAADVDGDGWWNRDELKRWFGAFAGRSTDLDSTDPTIDMAFDLFGSGFFGRLFGSGRDDALTKAAAQDFLRCMLSRGAMAHERVPPKGYIEAFEPNVAVTPTGITVTPRAVPLRPRIVAIEAEWRERTRRGAVR